MRTTHRTALLALGLLAAAAAPVAAATCPGPDTFGHTCPAAPTCAVTAPTSPITPLTDDGCIIRPIGFTYKHYGVSFTDVGVAMNGYLKLGNCTGGTDFTNDCPIPNTLTANDSTYGVWDDLRPDSTTGGAAAITDGVTGAAPNRVYTVRYDNVSFFNNNAAKVTFEIQLHENGGNGDLAKVNIISKNTTADTTSSATTGIENASGTDALSSSCSTAVAALTLGCREFSKSAAPPSTGDCAAIETKLDTRVIPVINATQTTVNTINTNVNTINTNVNQIQATVNNININTQATRTAVQAVEAKLDGPIGAGIALIQQIHYEFQLLNIDRTSVLYLPAAYGGKAEAVRDLVDKVIIDNENAGLNVGNARNVWDSGVTKFNNGDYKGAFDDFRTSYRTVVTGN